MKQDAQPEAPAPNPKAMLDGFVDTLLHTTMRGTFASAPAAPPPVIIMSFVRSMAEFISFVYRGDQAQVAEFRRACMIEFRKSLMRHTIMPMPTAEPPKEG